MTTCTTKVIEVIVIFDTETILRNHEPGTVDLPSELDNADGVILIATRGGGNGSPGNHLRIAASPLDLVRWRESTLSVSADHAALFYRTDFPQASPITEPRPALLPRPAPLPNRRDPADPDTQDILVHCWQSTVLDRGSARCAIAFMVIDDEGKQQGCYFWKIDIEVDPIDR